MRQQKHKEKISTVNLIFRSRIVGVRDQFQTVIFFLKNLFKRLDSFIENLKKRNEADES